MNSLNFRLGIFLLTIWIRANKKDFKDQILIFPHLFVQYFYCLRVFDRMKILSIDRQNCIPNKQIAALFCGLIWMQFGYDYWHSMLFPAPMVSLFVVCFAWSYYEPILAQHLSTFPVDWTVSMLVGAMMTMLSTSYLVSAPLLGFLMDRYLANQRTPMILFGGLLVFVSCLLMGPAPFLGLPKSLFCMGVAFVLLGIAGAILYVPVFQWCVNAAKSRGFDEKSPALCGLISGFFQSTTSLGAFLGTALGGLSAEKIGFEWTATWVAGMELVQLGLQLIYALAKRWRRSHQWQQQRIVPAKIHEIK